MECFTSTCPPVAPVTGHHAILKSWLEQCTTDTAFWLVARVASLRSDGAAEASPKHRTAAKRATKAVKVMADMKIAGSCLEYLDFLELFCGGSVGGTGPALIGDKSTNPASQDVQKPATLPGGPRLLSGAAFLRGAEWPTQDLPGLEALPDAECAVCVVCVVCA